MRALPAFLIVAALLLPALAPAAVAAPIKLPHLVKTEETVCERKPDGVYCGRGLKRKHLFQCAGGEIATSYVCAWGCDPKGQACIKRPPRKGAPEAAPTTDCNFTGQIKRADQARLRCN